MENNKKYIYGFSERSQIGYKFHIVSEDDKNYYVNDVSTSWYELEENIFTIEKANLKMTKSENVKFDFIVKDMSVLSFDKEDIIEANRQQQILLHKNEYAQIDGKIEDARKKLASIQKPKAYKPKASDLKTLKRNQIIFVLNDETNTKKIEKAVVVGKTIKYCDNEDNDYIAPIIDCDTLGIYDAVVRFDSFDKTFLVTKISDDYFFGERDFEVYLNEDDYKRKLEFEKYEEMEKRLNSLISHKKELEKYLSENS